MSQESLKSCITSGKGGVFHTSTHIAVSDVKKLTQAAGYRFFHLEGENIEKKEQFLNHAAMALHFPDYFGKNWDAFEECITDMSWAEADGYVIYFDHTDGFHKHHAAELDTLVEIFQDAVDEWDETPFIVVLHGAAVPKGVIRL